MTRSLAMPRSGRQRITQPLLSARPRAPRDPSITPLGFTCFKLVRSYGGPPGAPLFAVLPNPGSRNAMAALADRY